MIVFAYQSKHYQVTRPREQSVRRVAKNSSLVALTRCRFQCCALISKALAYRRPTQPIWPAYDGNILATQTKHPEYRILSGLLYPIDRALRLNRV